MTAVPVRPDRHGAAPRGPVPRSLTTFDCFDTVLTRAVGSPSHVAYPVAHAARRGGVLHHDISVVVAARRRAETLVWHREQDAGTLTDIWTQAAELLGVDDVLVPRLVELEETVEQRLLHAVPQALAEVRAARGEGPVGFLSDTPLPGAFLREVLRAAGAHEDGDHLWVSNELRASKNRGGAYFAVAQELGGAPGTWAHVGDSPRSDVTVAARSGVQGTLRRRAVLNRFEERLDAASAATAGFGALLAGVSRLTRLQVAETHPEVPAARARVLAGVAGPLLAGYVLWCLQRARRAGVRRLYFVARDGQVMLRMAQQLAPALGFDVDLRYLEGSRRAWLLPAMTTVDAARLAAVMGREEKITVRSCLSWVDLAPEAAQDVLARHGFPAGTYDDTIDHGAMARLIDVLVGPLAETVLSGVARRAEAARSYLRDVGLLDEEPYGLVDIGWQGTVGLLLTAVLEPVGGRPPALECYFGLNAPAREAPGRAPQGYMFDGWRGLGAGRTTDLWVAMETFTAALHGRVEDYEMVDGVAAPVHGTPNTAALAWGLAGQHAVLETYGAVLAEHLDLVDASVDVRDVTHGVLTEFWKHPRRDEVHAFGGYPFEADAETYPLAASFSFAQVAHAVREGRPRLRRRGTWPAGTRVAAPAYLRVAQRVVEGGRMGARKARRAYGFWLGRRAPAAPGTIRTATADEEAR